jgi:hypothetical protein
MAGGTRVTGWEVRDYEGTLITVGTKVTFDEDEASGVVTVISEPDGDYNDEVQRAVEIPPNLVVRLADGSLEDVRSYNDTAITWADCPDGPVLSTYRVDDLKVI